MRIQPFNQTWPLRNSAIFYSEIWRYCPGDTEIATQCEYRFFLQKW